MRIGDAAARLGLAPHVLRHWEDMGVLAPSRLPSGHRDYNQDTVDRARLIRVAQGIGLSLDEVREFTTTDDNAARLAAIDHHRARIHSHIELLRASDAFLAHVGDCVHPILAECPECSALVAYCETRRPARH